MSNQISLILQDTFLLFESYSNKICHKNENVSPQMISNDIKPNISDSIERFVHWNSSYWNLTLTNLPEKRDRFSPSNIKHRQIEQLLKIEG